MFFGRRGGPESVKPDALGVLLDSLFDKKLEPLKARASSIVGQLHRSKLQFAEACEEFGRLDVEPDTEDLYVANVSFIKSQKSSYARALRSVVDQLTLEVDSTTNVHSRYTLILSDVESATNKILKVNAAFKQVVHCYSNHLGDFKRAFSSMERLSESLRSELDRSAKDFSEYESVRAHISKLSAYSEELETLHKGMEALKKDLDPKDQSTVEKSELDASERLTSKEAELTSLNNKISELHNRIDLLTVPLERSAKKLDHLSAEKKQLHRFIEDPINSINDEAEYNEFRALVQRLKDAVDSGAIEIKNRSEVSRIAHELLNTDIHSMISSLKAVQQRRPEIDNEIRVLERALNAIKEGRAASERHAQEIETMERRAEEIEKSREHAKSMVEKLLLDYYGKSISITL